MNKKLIGQRLYQLRGTKSRELVSKELNISISALQMYENGQRIPRDEIKVKLANYYRKTVQEIFFESQSHKMCGIKNQLKEGIS